MGRDIEKYMNSITSLRGALIQFNGRVGGLAFWSRETGIQLSTLWRRLYRDNLSVEEALTKPVQKRNRKRK